MDGNTAVRQVLEKGTPLLASGGQEFDAWQEELAKATPQERLARQRKNLKSRLGAAIPMCSLVPKVG